MRVLFIKNDRHVPELNAGTEVSTHFLCRALIERGHEVCVAATTESGAARVDIGLGYPVHRAPLAAEASGAALSDFRPEVVVCQEAGRWLADGRFDALQRLPFIIYQHSVSKAIRDVPAPLRRRAIVLSNSIETAKHLLLRYRTASIVVPPLFGVDRYADLVPDGKHVLFVSLQSRKGADVAIAIARNRPDVPFVFVESWTEDREATRRYREAVASLSNVELLPNQEDLRGVFANTRLLLMPSRSREGWGRVVTEAQLCGIPVLGSSRGHLPATIGPGGVTLDPDDGVKRWLEAFDRIWRDRAVYEQLSARAREHSGHLAQQVKTALDRFERSVLAASNACHPTHVRMQRRQRPNAIRPAIEKGDILTLLRLCWSAPCAWLVPQVLWPSISRLAARVTELAAPGKYKPTAVRIAPAFGVPEKPHARYIATSVAAARYEMALQVLRGFRPGGWNPKIDVEGRETLERALARGRGVIIWTAHFVFAPNVVKMALHAMGHPMTHLSRPEHGFSKTRFGIKVLNPLRVRFENRYLERRLVLDKAQPGMTLLGAREVLLRNGVVSTTAGAWEGSRVVAANFLGGRIELACGPIWLAKETGAAIIPAIGVKTAGVDHFLVRLLEPIELSATKDEVELNEGAVADFLTALTPAILTDPDQWRGWSSLGYPQSET